MFTPTLRLELAMTGLVLVMGAVIVLAGCTSEFPVDDLGIVEPIQSTEAILGDDGEGASGPKDYSYSSTAVWEIEHDWHDVTAEAGLAWSSNSGMTWDQKFEAWIDGLGRIESHPGYYDTFEITTPTGKVLPSPYLECAEMAYFLRSLFASWYGLPFYVEARDGNGDRIYLGHFGFITRGGSRYGSTPKFSKYADYSDMTAAEIAAQGWPSDSSLRAREIYGNASDDQPFLGEDAHFGAYLDELLLNKRTGYFLLILLPYFGSVNLADDANTFHVTTDGISTGDVLLERWQRTGIGHTLVVKEVQWIDSHEAVVELASGSMPRRQAKWESSTGSKMYFTSDYTGGQGSNSDGHAYVDLGGGLKRFLSPEVINGRWYANVPEAQLDEFIPTNDKETRAARPAQFEEMLAEVSAEELMDELMIVIEDKREHLRNHPSSCSARIAREDTFDKLYEVGAQLGMSKQDVDEQYRTLEDYVFAELVYDESKTCCWNSTTRDMYEIVMAYNTELVEADPDTCLEPEVFKAEDGGYETFADYATQIGRGDQWVSWSADESCPQANVTNDTEEAHGWTDYCTIYTTLLDPSADPGDDDPGDDPGDDPAGDVYEPNEEQAGATAVGEGAYGGMAIGSATDEDWFVVTGGGTVTARIDFSHSAGDLDLELLDDGGARLDLSQGTVDSETVEGSGSPVYVRVYGYSGATGEYQLTITID